jgi:hypothetical protein
VIPTMRRVGLTCSMRPHFSHKQAQKAHKAVFDYCVLPVFEITAEPPVL